MSAKYIIRLDDAHPKMNHIKWDRIESICNIHGITPIVAIIPENCDKQINYNQADDHFWERAKKWQNNQWWIALHGYKHILKPTAKGLVKINNYSEFVGLPFTEQLEMISNAFQLFLKHEIKPKVWVSPAHGLDINTIKSILVGTDIKIISDGFAFSPYIRFGIKWIPQQLWRFRKMPFGIWTVCLHPSEMSDEDFNAVDVFMAKNRNSFPDLSSLVYHHYCFYDVIFVFIYQAFRNVKNLIRSFRIPQ